MPEVTQQVMGNEVARCSGPFTLTAPGRREGRRREEGGKEEGSQQGGLRAWTGGGGAEVPLQPSECEPGLAGAGVQRQRREEQARAGQERRGRDGGGERPWQGAEGESESQAVLGTLGMGSRGQPETSHPKQPKGTRRRLEV